ncbi:MAG: DUF134 domain-containing protein [Clostridia bacterium]|nr:DUF134 domain-containing protein [Clostridia bacterium]
MSRPTKCRRVCRVPDTLSFAPTNGGISGNTVVLTLDEYETIRLIDREGRLQAECSEQMGISRTTVQKIYETARKKLAEAIVDGLPLRIEGGEYSLCDGKSRHCKHSNCYKQEIEQNYFILKGENIMRIAVTYENGEVFQHFGHTEKFKVYDIDGDRITETQIVSTNGQGHGALADVLNSLNVDMLICGGIGGGAKMALASLGIKLYGGVSGSADAAVEAFLANNLNYNPDVKCNHHDHEHGDTHHICGNHGCGHENCKN